MCTFFLVIIFLILLMVRSLESNYFLVRTKLGCLRYVAHWVLRRCVLRMCFLIDFVDTACTLPNFLRRAKKIKNLKILFLKANLQIVHWGINPPPQKHHPRFLAKPPLNRQTAKPPFLGNPLYWFSVTQPSPLKVGFFSEPQKYKSFLSLALSCLLKVTKFLVKIYQFEFVVMTKKNIFAYELFINCSSPPPFLGNRPPPTILVFRDPPPPLKVGFFSEPSKY